MRCCICRNELDARYCQWCGHNFCGNHRWGWVVWERGLTALKEWLCNNPPKYCEGHDGKEASTPLPNAPVRVRPEGTGTGAT